MKLIKFGRVCDDENEPSGYTEIPYEYGNVYQRVTMRNGAIRLEVGVSSEQVRLLRELSAVLEPPFRLLYVLIVARSDQDAGRYESASSLDFVELTRFLTRYEAAFEQDGRHALWIIASNGQLVFTPHDIVYAYGPEERLEAVLRGRYFSEDVVDGAAKPHAHYYHEQFDPIIRDLLETQRWRHFPLEEMDEQT